MTPPAEGCGERIAVVAVHGVAYHAPNASAREVANLLVDASLVWRGGPDGRKQAAYTPFVETSLDIDVQPVVHAAAPPADDAGIALMHRLLDGYQPEGDDAVYRTVRYEGQRLAPGRRPSADVHVYEMYWNDLSQVGRGLLSFFSSLYLLLFHVGDLGTLTVEHMGEGAKSKWLSDMLLWLQRGAVWLLTVLIPLVNLLLLAVSVSILAWLGDGTWASTTAVAAPGIAALLAAAPLSWRLARAKGGRAAGSRAFVSLFVAATIGGGAAGLAYACLRLLQGDRAVEPAGAVVLAMEIILLALGLLARFVGRNYSRYREKIGRVAYPLCVLGAGGALLMLGSELSTTRAGEAGRQMIANVIFKVVSVGYALLFGSWAVFLVLVLFFAAGGLWLQPWKIADAKLGPDIRAWWTGVLSLVVPGLLLLAVTLGLWSSLAWASRGAWEGCRIGTYGPGRRDVSPGAWAFRYPEREAHSAAKTAGAGAEAGVFVTALITATARPLPVVGLAAAAAALLLVWGLAPSVRYELVPPGRGEPSARSGDMPPHPRSEVMRSEWLGAWLTETGRLTRPALGLLLLGLVVGLPLGYWMPADHGLSHFFGLAGATPQTGSAPAAAPAAGATTAATAVTAGAAALAALGAALTRLQAITGNLGAVVGVALDVDNHLRQLPKHRTPRARMCARYASLLRYLARWRDDEGRPYDRIVIVAHSQGSVLTADLLRYLRADLEADAGRTAAGAHGGSPPEKFVRREPSLVPRKAGGPLPPVFLFTMGCPLRQLYAVRFPRLYRWAGADGQRAECCSAGDVGVECWDNVYRSGDYVGRALWEGPDGPAVWTYHGAPHPVVGAAAQAETCIGAGGHVHYWDETAPEVAQHIDCLVSGREVYC